MTKKQQTGTEHTASSKMTNLSVSTKHCVEIAHYLRYKNTNFAKAYLEEVIALKQAVPMRRFRRDVGHKKGMAAGRFPQKAAKEFLKLMKSVEANAQNKGLSTANLKIIKLVSNKASTPSGGGRSRTGTKRSHIEIEVREGKEIKKKEEKKNEKKVEAKKPVIGEEVKKEEIKVKEPNVGEKKVEQAPEKEAPIINEENKESESKEEINEQPKEIKIESKEEQTNEKPEGENKK